MRYSSVYSINRTGNTQESAGGCSSRKGRKVNSLTFASSQLHPLHSGELFNVLFGHPLSHVNYSPCLSTQLNFDDKGLEAILFTADGDMRQAINNLQSTYTGFTDITSDNVFKVIIFDQLCHERDHGTSAVLLGL